jgi:hypothetical protein
MAVLQLLIYGITKVEENDLVIFLRHGLANRDGTLRWHADHRCRGKGILPTRTISDVHPILDITTFLLETWAGSSLSIISRAMDAVFFHRVTRSAACAPSDTVINIWLLGGSAMVSFWYPQHLGVIFSPV